MLFEDAEQTGTLNHLGGVERASVAEVHAESRRLRESGVAVELPADEECCHAYQNKFWVTGPPDGQRWENYVVLADSTPPELEGLRVLPTADGTCCTTA